MLIVIWAAVTSLLLPLSAEATGPSPVPSARPNPRLLPKKRFVFRTRTAAMGVRGLHEGTLKDAVPNLAELALLERWTALPGSPSPTGTVLTPDARPSTFPIPAADEVAAGKKLTAALLGAAPLVRNEKVQRYLHRVGLRIAAQSGRPELPWTFALIASDSINAFASPGGTVLLTLGLYRLIQTEAELAMILAHEIAHIAQGHSIQLFLKQRALEEAVKGTGRVPLPPPVRAALRRQLKPGALFFAAALERESEFEADRLAAVFARDAGYAPRPFLNILHKLDTQPNSSRGEMHLLLKTHPSPQERHATLAPLLVGRLAESPRSDRDGFEAHCWVDGPLLLLDRELVPPTREEGKK